MKHLTLLILVSLLGLRLKTLDRDYNLFTPETPTLIPHIDNFNISRTFDLGGDKVILFGTQIAPKRGVGVVLFDVKSKQKILQDFSEGDEDFITPHFFSTTKPSDPIIILSTIGAEYTFGVNVYAFEKNGIRKIGYMDIALNENPNESSTDPGQWTLIKKHDDELSFSFSKQVATDFQGKNQKNYSAGQLTYHYKDGQFTIRTN